ncbi:hypothetical protein EV128_1263 [Rhizobium azibense]|nr:hypothetical protein EV128_1263 [Rhizobium azibense]
MAGRWPALRGKSNRHFPSSTRVAIVPPTGPRKACRTAYASEVIALAQLVTAISQVLNESSTAAPDRVAPRMVIDVPVRFHILW